MKRLLQPVLSGIIILLLPGSAPAGRIQPSDLIYRGAFRLPGPEGGPGWGWSGHALAYCPEGDPGGPPDGYPGSLFGTGHNWYQYVSEIDIPVPVISPEKNLDDLNTARTLQPFADIRGNLFDYLDFEQPRAGLAWLPRQGGQPGDRLYFTWGQHQQQEMTDPPLGWCDRDLSSFDSVGPWRIGNYLNQVTTDYLIDIPQSWADIHLSGRSLGAGRYQDGGQGAQGPALIACGPWREGNPPAAGRTITAVPLLLYEPVTEPDPESMDRYHHSDMWSGAAWLTAGSGSALVFAGTKGRGDCWYGNPAGPCHECDNRGWWSDYFDGEIIFYDTDDLAAVASGTMASCRPQPYAVMKIDDLLYHIDSPQMYDHVGAASFDRAGGTLYLFEPLADGDQPLVHVWKIAGSGEPTPAPDPSPPPEIPVYGSGDYNGDGTAEIAVFRESTGVWAIRGVTRAYFGGGGDRPVPGDYDGDGTTGLAVFRPGSGLWAIRRYTRAYFGSAIDRPIPGDYDGDGSCDPGIFRESSGLWALRDLTRIYYGGEGDIPVPGDYDGDGTDEIGIFRRSSGLWAIRSFGRVYYGSSDATAVPGDYDGNGRRDPGIFRRNAGLWAIRGVTRAYFGDGSDTPVPADFAGDGKTEIGTFRPSSGLWKIRELSRVYFGSGGDLPVVR